MIIFLHVSQVENLQEQIKDKDKQLVSLGDRMTSLQADSRNTDTALITLEEALSEKVLNVYERTRRSISVLIYLLSVVTSYK